MAELVWKQLIPVGVHHAPVRDPLTGAVRVKPLAVDKQRIRHFYEKFRELKDRGVHFPVPFAHKLTAVPEERVDSEEDWQKAIEARNQAEVLANAAYIEDMRIAADGSLEFAMHPPPGFSVCQDTFDLINPHTSTRIREISAGIGNWRDGTGKLHRDIIMHAALCTMPVVAGMRGFRQDGPVAGMTQLSAGGSIEWNCFLSTRTGSPAMAKEDLDLNAAVPAPDDDLFEEEEDEDLPPPKAPAEEPAEPVVKTTDHCEQLIQVLADMGVQLLPDTTEKNFCERLLAVLTGLAAAGGKFELNQAPENNELTPAPASTAEQAQPAAPPMSMMSTRQIRDPFTRKLAVRQEKQLRAELVAAWDEMKAMGVPVHICDRESGRAPTVMLSLNAASGKFVLPQPLVVARKLKKILKAMQAGPTDEQASLSTAAAPGNPAAESIRSHIAVKNGTPPEPGKTSDGEDHAAWLGGWTKRLLGANAQPKLNPGIGV